MWTGKEFYKEIHSKTQYNHQSKNNEDSGIWNIKSFKWTILKINHGEINEIKI
jgi:hypothetical protein